MDTTPYQYVFVREDIAPEQVIVQTTHAASKAAVRRIDDDEMRNLHLIVLGTKNERSLINIMHMLEQHEYKFDYFIEPDMNGGEITAVATGAVSGSRREFFQRFELLTVSRKKSRAKKRGK